MPKNSFSISETGRRNLRIAWVVFLLPCIVLYVWYAPILTKENIATFVSRYNGYVLAVYFVVCVLRGLTLVPATPFLLAGIYLFQHTPLLLFIVFLSSIFIVSAFLFYASGYLGFCGYFEKLYPNKTGSIKQKLNSPLGWWFVLLWSFTPFTPTDLVCYAAGSLRMRFIQFIVPLMIGEGLICALYIFNGAALLR
ncbi:VTT domain-containing protein [Foetidibacter luteolus]|uniref:VTT domain-containing protein n=1 Tax=Foetidibacter luteolus TaxID=2608880 RepID=UPI00129BBE2E|nr:VTT domain-containing protein [Foetidibacter luteolus]